MAEPNQTTEKDPKDPRDLRDHAGQAHGQEDGRGPATQVNYSAGLDPDYDGVSESSPGNPMDDAMAIRGMFGAIHNELNEVNSNIIEQSSGLKAKTIDKGVMDRDILNLVGAQQPQAQVPGRNIPPGMNASGIGNMPSPDIVPNVLPDPNQIEFNFDNSATAQDIFNKLNDIEKKVVRFSKDLQHITELLEKKK